MDLSIRVIAFNAFCNSRCFASRHPHLSVVQIFKDQAATSKKPVCSREARLWRKPRIQSRVHQLFLLQLPLP